MQRIDLLIVGVGGQGTLLASKVFGKAALNADCDVKISEVHGMAQRGGSVVTHVRIADKVFSPLVEEGKADMIIAFESLEALRWLTYLKQGGTMIVNEQRISPMPVVTGSAAYPQGINEKLSQRAGKVVALNALEIAKDCGNAKALNIVMLGAAAKLIGGTLESWETAVAESVPEKTREINLRAFTAGYGFSSK